MRQVVSAALVACLLTGHRGIQRTDAAALQGGSEFPLRGISKLIGQLPNGATLRPLDKCPVKTTGNVSCADLIVPERRDVPGSRSITVRAAVLHASDEGLRPDPYVHLMGGQGQGYAVLNELAMLPDLIHRDVITLEQRGTQLALPFFGCPGVEGGLNGIDQNLVSQPSSADPAEIRRCEAEIKQAGIDKNGYDTAASADDLWDLKQLLGIDQWNLFGVSYGGRTAESFLRKHPGAARSLILDSIQVTGIPFIYQPVLPVKFLHIVTRATFCLVRLSSRSRGSPRLPPTGRCSASSGSAYGIRGSRPSSLPQRISQNVRTSSPAPSTPRDSTPPLTSSAAADWSRPLRMRPPSYAPL